MSHVTRWVRYSQNSLAKIHMFYKLGQACVRNWDSFVYYKLGQILLQIGAVSLLKIGASVVTNWGSYYKLAQSLLQNRAAITNWGKIYYILGQVLQIRAIITNYGKTAVNFFSKSSILTWLPFISCLFDYFQGIYNRRLSKLEKSITQMFFWSISFAYFYNTFI